MWNSRKHAAMAIVGAGLAVAAATPASAWWGSGYGGYYGAPYGYGDYGYSDDFPYAGAGYNDYLSYGYSGYGAYDAAGWSGSSYGYDYGPAYGYASYGYRRPCGGAFGLGWAAYHPRGYNYAVAYRRPAGNAVADTRLHRPYTLAAYAPRSDRHVYAAAKHHNLAMKPLAQNKVAYRVQNPKLARND
jgi:hypothetical protein